MLPLGRISLATCAFVACPWALVAQGETDWQEQRALAVEIHGFGEAATASRIVGDTTQPDDFLLREARFRLDLSHVGERAEFTVKADLTADGASNVVEIDIRQATITLRLADWLDFRGGRQVLTWGTGDLVFLNDLFPKDFVSFFIGRDDEFLKAPSNAMKFTFYSDVANLDVVWTPIFEPDRFITGERLSFFDPSAGARVSATTMGGPVESLLPAREVGNGEVAGRLFRTIGGYELSVYGYWGFTKQPTAFDAASDMPVHARLAVYGMSIRGSVLGGIAYVEGAVYDSPDNAGADPNVPNSQIRGLAGYERELQRDLTGGFQYYVESMQDYDALIANSATPQFEPPKVRHTFTGRLTRRLMRETLRLSLFTFVSPSDRDVHVRPSVTKKWSDAVTIAVGANIMAGDESAFFGQLQGNSNAYLRIRYSF